MDEARRAKVDELDDAAREGDHQYVLGLEVAMNDAERMDERERFENLPRGERIQAQGSRCKVHCLRRCQV